MMTALQDLLASLPEAIDWLYHPPVVLTAYGMRLEFKSKLYALLTEYDKHNLFIAEGKALSPVVDAAMHSLEDSTYALDIKGDETGGFNLVLCNTGELDDVLLAVTALVTKHNVSVEVAFIITDDAEEIARQLNATTRNTDD